ncbi:MAG: sirohydrochlorin cobaltochelatase [Kiritimatiellia bacterium]
MQPTTDPADAQLLVALQKGLPLVARPFAHLGSALGLTEEAVLTRVRNLFATGVARRFGAVFDSRSLGYESTLCAADVPEAELEAAVARIVPHPGITHCYAREGHPNLWFTMTAPAADLLPEIADVAAALGPYEVMNLPALRKFKIEAVFGQNANPAAAATPGGRASTRAAASLTPRERQVVRRLQANITVCEDPFGLLASELDFGPAELLTLLQQWEQAGVIRRIGLVLRHRQLGFSANSMCVWPVATDRIEAAGASMAKSPHVTHCYERPSFAAFPFNLYAMIHAKSREEAIGIFQQLGANAGLSDGHMLWSVREFKKASPQFFCERTGILFATPGSTCHTAQGVYARINRTAAQRFPGVAPRWCFTSGPVRRKLTAQGLPAPDPQAALAAMQAEGLTRVVVMPLHLTDGMEFGELSEIVAAWASQSGASMTLALGRPLLTSESGWRYAIQALLAGLQDAQGQTRGSRGRSPSLPAPDAAAQTEGDASSQAADPERIILVLHGSQDPQGRKTLEKAAQLCHTVDPRLLMGVLLGKPDLPDVVRACQSAGVKKAWLLPCMVVAGLSAREEVAGAGAQSWASVLQHAGIETVPVVQGLGEIPAIVQIWLDEIASLLGETAEY